MTSNVVFSVAFSGYNKEKKKKQKEKNKNKDQGKSKRHDGRVNGTGNRGFI